MKDLETSRDMLRSEISGLNRDLEAERKIEEAAKKHADDIMREREVVSKHLMRETEKCKQQAVCKICFHFCV